MQNQEDSAWVCGATSTCAPENLSMAKRGRACMAARVIYWAGGGRGVWDSAPQLAFLADRPPGVTPSHSRA
eukprot:5641470-Pyramimonas_sp.AAC.1